MTSDKKKINLVIIGIFTMLLGLAPFMYLFVRQGDYQIGNVVGAGVVVLLAIFMSILAFNRIKDMKKGQPYEDELSKKILNITAARTFYISFYWILILMIFDPVFAGLLFKSEKMDASQALGGTICGMVVIFLLNWLYFQKKGVEQRYEK
jgi:uncharacterized membrane protein